MKRWVYLALAYCFGAIAAVVIFSAFAAILVNMLRIVKIEFIRSYGVVLFMLPFAIAGTAFGMLAEHFWSQARLLRTSLPQKPNP